MMGLALWAGAAAVQGSPEAAGTRRALVVCGLPGDDQHRAQYAEAVETIVGALTEKYGFAASEVRVRFGDAAREGDGPALKGAQGISNRAGIEAGAAELRRVLGPDDTLWVIVLGHGHFDGRHSHWNIPGPDLDDRAFGKLFEGLRAREQVFFITTSASGFFLKPLAAPGRVVITATEPDREVNETIFPLALAEVLATPPEGIDRNHDGVVSVLELYLAVALDVLRRYDEAGHLPTEHARLDDNGDGHGSEIQQEYVPPELGGRDPKRAPRVLGPKDDGFLAGRLRTAPAPKTGQSPGEGPRDRAPLETR